MVKLCITSLLSYIIIGDNQLNYNTVVGNRDHKRLEPCITRIATSVLMQLCSYVMYNI